MVSVWNAWDHDPFLTCKHEKKQKENLTNYILPVRQCSSSYNSRIVLKIGMIWPASNPGIRKAVRHARMAHKATKWPIKKILTGPVMRPDRTKLVK